MNPIRERANRQFGHHHGGPHGPRPAPIDGMRSRSRHGGRGRAPRGDVRTAVLLLLAEQPMHGYQLMQAISDRTGGRWTPSPGAIYPTINQLEDEGLVTITAKSGRKLVTLTTPAASTSPPAATPGPTRSPTTPRPDPAPICAGRSSSCAPPSVRSLGPAPMRNALPP